MPLEQDKSGGFKLSLADGMPSGLHPGLFSRKIPLWEEGQNVEFTDVGVKKIRGWSLIADTTNGEPIRGLLQNTEGAALDERIIYAGDLTQLYRIDADDGTVEVVGTGFNLAGDSGASVWDGGSTTWDTASSLWDDGVVKADHWSLVNYGTFALATSGADAPLIRKNAGDFVDMPGGVTGIFISVPGTGYTAGDTLTLTGGDGSGATAEVITVNAGAITKVGMTSAGSGYTTPPTGFTGGTGTGASFTFTVCDMDVSTVEIFAVRGPHILGFNTSASPREFIWCDADDPDTWVTASDNLAGALEIRELNSEIVAAVPLADRIAVYGTDQMFLVNYLGNELVFGYQPALNGVGAVSKKSVVPVGRKNYGLSTQGFFVTDGATFQYIDEPAMRKWYRENAALGQIAKASAHHDEANNQVRWHFPTTSSMITQGLSFNYRTGTWSILFAAKSAGDERRVLSHAVTGSETGALYREGPAWNDDTEAMVAYARTKPLDLGDADRIKELDSIRIGFIGTGLQYRIGWSEAEGGTINWGAYTDVSEGFGFHNLRTAGRWLYIEFYSGSLNAYWEIMNCEVIGRVEGTR